MGLGLKERLKPRNLLIQRTRRNAEISEFAEPRYTRGTRSDAPLEPVVHTSKIERV